MVCDDDPELDLEIKEEYIGFKQKSGPQRRDSKIQIDSEDFDNVTTIVNITMVSFSCSRSVSDSSPIEERKR